MVKKKKKIIQPKEIKKITVFVRPKPRAKKQFLGLSLYHINCQRQKKIITLKVFQNTYKTAETISVGHKR